MPKSIVEIAPVGNIDRRSLPHQGNPMDVLSRENFYVVGINKEDRKVKKLAGADRFSKNVAGTTYRSGIRYYSKNDVRRTFAYNTDGYIYYLDENGNETQKIGIFSTTARPVWGNYRVSDSDILYFSEGVDTGMYSYDGNLENTFVKEDSVTLNLVDMVSWLDRNWGFEEDEEILYGSKNLVPTNFTDSTDAIAAVVGAKAGSKLQRVVLFKDTLYIFKTDTIWRVLGRTPSEFQIELVHDTLGLSARWSLHPTDNGFIFLGSDYEFYFFGGSKESTQNLTYKLALTGDLTDDLGEIINKNKMDLIEATYHNYLYRCSFAEHGQPTPNLEYLYNTVNQTESFSRGFNVSCYIKYGQVPDKQELLTGRHGEGLLMRMGVGHNVDNQASNPTMSFKTQSKFIGLDEPINMRIKKVWCDFGVLRKEPVGIRLYKDARTAKSDSSYDEMTPYGEAKALLGMTGMASQSMVTPRYVPKWDFAKGRNFSLSIDDNKKDMNFEFSKFFIEAIAPKNKKRSRHANV